MRSPEQVSELVALNLRRLRHAQALTIDTLCERAGVSKGTIIQVEQARANPSISTLCRLADALGVGVATLVESPPAPRITVRRRGETPVLWSSEAGSAALFLMGTDPPNIVELWDWRLQPGDAFHGEEHPPGTVEMLAVLEGALEVGIGEERRDLDVGDTVLFDAVVPHRYANPGEVPNRFVMSVLQPTGGPLGDPDTIAPAADHP